MEARDTDDAHMNRIRIALAVAAIAFLWIGAAGADPFPDSWEGEILMKGELRDFFGGPKHFIQEGKMDFHVVASNVSGDASITVTYDWNQTPCKASGKESFNFSYAGTLGPIAAAGTGQFFRFQMPMDQAAHYSETIHCKGIGTRTVPRLWYPPLLPALIPLVDAVPVTQTGSLGDGGTGTFTATLNTPCAGWDASKDPGPQIKFVVRDPRTVEQPETLPDYSLDSSQLTAMAGATLGAGENARRSAFGSKDLGLTSHPKAEDFHFEFVGLSTAGARKPYAECISWTTLELTIPEDRIHTWIASDVGTDGACAHFIEDHERRHRKQSWATLQGIASEVEVMARNEIPGPTNQRPMALSGGADILKLTVHSKIQSVITRNIQELEASILATDNSPTEQTAGKTQCPAFAGSKH